MLVIYLSAVVVAIVLRHQERRHQTELALLYERLDMSMPSHRPKLHKGESWVHIVVGTLLVMLGSLALAANIAVMQVMEVPNGQWELCAVMLATGMTLFFLGLRSLRENKTYERALGDQKAV
ncbi:MAG: hypothetical protein NTZ35_18620 [Ignavibacteriales bacterium]|nr:hypothetical protein [Ignavibacteriales bacterium]